MTTNSKQFESDYTKLFAWFFFSFLSIARISAQERTYFVMDETGTPASYASIVVFNDTTILFDGFLAEDAKFVLNPVALGRNGNVRVTHFSYQTRTISIEGLRKQESDTIVLKMQENFLNEVPVVSSSSKKRSPLIVGFPKEKEKSFFIGAAGSSIACYLKLKTGGSGIIEDINILFSEKSKGSYPYRIRFLEAPNGSESPPSKTMLYDKTFIVNSPDGGGWQKIDVSEEHFVIDKQGLYIVIDWLPTESLEVYEVQWNKKVCTKQASHMALAMYHAKAENVLYWKKNKSTQNWKKPQVPNFIKTTNNLRLSNPIIYLNAWEK